MTQIPCGKTMGHGERCAEGRVCDHCVEILRLREAVQTPQEDGVRRLGSFVLKLTGANNDVPIFYDWTPGTTMASVLDANTKKRVATALGHIHAVGPALLVAESPEEILGLLELDVRRVVKSALLLPPKNLS